MNLNVSSEHLNVQAEELKARINENERLHSQVWYAYTSNLATDT